MSRSMYAAHARRLILQTCLALALFAAPAIHAETVFVEAESFNASSSGWALMTNDQTRLASRAATLWGADGPGDSVATKRISIGQPGRYRIWVRYFQIAAWRGPFQLSIGNSEKEFASQVFDRQSDPTVPDWEYTWKSFDADLSAGEMILTLAKHEQKNCVGYVRHVDCVLVTSDQQLVPDHVPFGPQTYMRVTLGDIYDRPAYMHMFVDHYRAPWYAHYALARDGIHEAVQPPGNQLLSAGEATPWCNLTPTVFQDSGAILNLSVRHSYVDRAEQGRATVELGRASSAMDESIEIVKTFEVDVRPNGIVIIVPPDLESERNIARLQRDRDFAEATGRLADAFPWPTHGRRPKNMPFLVSAHLGGYDLPVDDAVHRREQKTLDYFGFNGDHDRILGGLWILTGDSYCRPDVDAMRSRATKEAETFRKAGRTLDDLAACMLMDEPTGQSLSFIAQDAAYRESFREWLQQRGLLPQHVLVAKWEDVRPVDETERDTAPALYYYSELFRTRALGDFMATQRKIIEDAYEGSLPTLVNFSDGAVYYGNFCGQGVNYFELLDDDGQNAIWGEDWANNASTYQCAGFNVDVMRAAARRRGQTIGHYLIAHAGRTAWDIKTKATSETMRGVRMWMNFSYGPSWATHEGGPPWQSHVWYAKPETWAANAEITREIGAVEDWLLSSRHAAAEVAVLYSESSDIWTWGHNLAYGFDRMHAWLALAHAQVPADIVPEREIADGQLDRYKVCYLSGPNLSRAAAQSLRAWVKNGGILWLSAGAATRDEFNRPLDALEELLPAERETLATLEPYLNSGRFLNSLAARDTVQWDDSQLEVLSVQQPLVPKEHAQVLARFADGRAAVVSGMIGRGQVLVAGFLPALAYIKPALAARQPHEDQAARTRLAAERLAASRTSDGQPEATSAEAATRDSDELSPNQRSADRELFERSYNPWEYSADIRERLLTPVRKAAVSPPLVCDTALVDAATLPCEQGLLIGLSNFTLRPLEQIQLRLRSKQPVAGIESVRHGALECQQLPTGEYQWSMPLHASDFVKVTLEGPAEN